MILFEKESFDLIGVGMAVHRELANGYLEAVYQEAFAIELEERGIPFEREKQLRIQYRGHVLDKCYYADFVCHGKIVVELKAVPRLSSEHSAQVLNYLKATGSRLGFLFNFGAPSFQYKRLIF